MISWASYLRNFTERYDAILPDLLKDGALEFNGGPILGPVAHKYPRSAPWRCDWGAMFPDGMYFRVKETFDRVKTPFAGLGMRVHFSFHYGLAHTRLVRGFPEINPRAIPSPPVADLRIDMEVNKAPHIHVHSPEHIWQDSVSGFDIQEADMFSFLEAVRNHRDNRTIPLVDLLGIKVLD